MNPCWHGTVHDSEELGSINIHNFN